MASASVIILLFFPLYQNTWAENGQLSLVPLWSDWIYIAIMAWVCSVYAYSAAINLTKKLSVFFIQLALNLEPVYGITLALIVFGNKEVMSLNFYIGTTIIISAVAIYPLLKKRMESQFK
jgi:drug/metabolite transporter (DMT)-like permease